MTARPSQLVTPRNRTLGLAGLAALGALAARHDYGAWRALGEGGLPATPLGWAGAWFIRLGARNTTDPGRHERALGTRGDRARLQPLPPRNGPRPGALRVRISRHAPGYSPAAAAPRTSWATVIALLQAVAGRPVTLEGDSRRLAQRLRR